MSPRLAAIRQRSPGSPRQAILSRNNRLENAGVMSESRQSPHAPPRHLVRQGCAIRITLKPGGTTMLSTSRIVRQDALNEIDERRHLVRFERVAVVEVRRRRAGQRDACCSAICMMRRWVGDLVRRNLEPSSAVGTVASPQCDLLVAVNEPEVWSLVLDDIPGETKGGSSGALNDGAFLLLVRHVYHVQRSTFTSKMGLFVFCSPQR